MIRPLILFTHYFERLSKCQCRWCLIRRASEAETVDRQAQAHVEGRPL